MAVQNPTIMAASDLSSRTVVPQSLLLETDLQHINHGKLQAKLVLRQM